MNTNEKTEIKDLTERLKKLDEKSLTIIDTGSRLLLARQELDNKEKEPVEQ